ncbi:hypothetical protein [uncultured Neptuniibacter sp.]|uniref:hypothetical protein n=1 Tax=uncultured Neptuniibacter sp. TaxID=502143 RepID=UPI0026049FDF|nr:hypothetical protein [uncultured Neptuniibacter sp.]
MQHGFIIVRIDAFTSEQSESLFKLEATDHLHRKVVLLGNAEQQVNIQTLKDQILPVVMLSDQLETSFDQTFAVPATSLVSIVPLPSVKLKHIIDAGKADQILQSLSLVNG